MFEITIQIDHIDLETKERQDVMTFSKSLKEIPEDVNIQTQGFQEKVLEEARQLIDDQLNAL